VIEEGKDKMNTQDAIDKTQLIREEKTNPDFRVTNFDAIRPWLSTLYITL